MKKIITISFALISLVCSAQLTEIDNPSNLELLPISVDGEIKLKTITWEMDVTSVQLYNADLSFWKEVNFPEITLDTNQCEFYLQQVIEIGAGDNEQRISLHSSFVNQDSKIEYFLEDRCWSGGWEGERNSKKVLRLLNEDQELIQSWECDSGSFYLLGWGNQLRLQTYYPNDDGPVHYYQLEGQFPCALCELSMPTIKQSIQKEKSELNVFPNPSFGSNKIVYQLPTKYNKGVINLFDSTGALIREFQVTQKSGVISMNTSKFNSGTYYYVLKSEEGEVLSTRKSVVIH